MKQRVVQQGTDYTLADAANEVVDYGNVKAQLRQLCANAARLLEHFAPSFDGSYRDIRSGMDGVAVVCKEANGVGMSGDSSTVHAPRPEFVVEIRIISTLP